MGLAELAKTVGKTKKQIEYLATIHPLPKVALVSGFARPVHFYKKTDLMNWFHSAVTKREMKNVQLEKKKATA
jgi:hypothetical protein